MTRKLFRAADAAVGKRMTSKSRLLIFLYPPFDARVRLMRGFGGLGGGLGGGLEDFCRSGLAGLPG